jgi:PleD family two-component response regulator
MGTDELLQACDAALLRSKRQGKGRVTRAPASSP